MAREHVQDIIAALNGLGNNLQRLQLQRTLTQANEAVQQIRTSEADEEDQRQALRSVAEQLTFNLTAQGASPQQVAQVTGAVNPAPTNAQLMQMQRMQLSQQNRAQDIVIKASDQLQKAAANDFKALSAARNLRNLASQGKPLSDAALRVFAARASGEVGNLSEAEQAAFSGNQALLSKVVRAIKRGAFGTLPDSDRQEFISLATAMEEGAQANIQTTAQRVARPRARALGVTEDRFVQEILPSDFGGTTETQRGRGKFSGPGFD